MFVEMIFLSHVCFLYIWKLSYTKYFVTGVNSFQDNAKKGDGEDKLNIAYAFWYILTGYWELVQ